MLSKIKEAVDYIETKIKAKPKIGMITGTGHGNLTENIRVETIITYEDKIFLVTGSPGGSTIINTVLQVVVNAIDHRMNIEDAVRSPRFHHQWQPDIVRYEVGAMTDKVVNELNSMGHKGLSQSRFSLGDANSIMLIDNTLEGVSDPRNEGGVAGF